jgi:hypothetical protein
MLRNGTLDGVDRWCWVLNRLFCFVLGSGDWSMVGYLDISTQIALGRFGIKSLSLEAVLVFNIL